MSGRAEQVLDTHPRRRARRRSSRSPRCGRSATSSAGGASSSSRAPSGHGSCDRSTVTRSIRSRSSRLAAEARYGPSHSSTRARQRLGAPVRPRLTDRAVEERDPLAERERRRVPAEHGEAGCGDASPAAHAWCRRRAGPGARTRRGASHPSRRSTRSTTSSRSGSHSTPNRLGRPDRRARGRPRRRRARLPTGSATGRADRRGRRRRRTPRGRAGRAPEARRRCPSGAGTGRVGDAPASRSG